MKKLYFLVLTFAYLNAEEIELPPLTLSVSGAQQTHMPIAIIILDEKNKELTTIANIIKKDVQFTDQFKARIETCNADISKKELRKKIVSLAHKGTPLALCIGAQTSKAIEWRLYDTMQCTMLQGKKYKKIGSVVRGWAHTIADETWKIVTGNEGFFSSRLAYCKDSHDDRGHTLRKIYIADFDGGYPELLVDLPTITIAPRWHPKKPLLSYAEYTDTNVRLMSTEMNKKKKTISTLDGINMLASFAANGKDYVYCASHGNGSCQIYLNKNDTLKRCTKNTGNNTSPLFIDEEHVCFCSDFQKGNPQIYFGNIITGHLQRITKGGYCTSPSYCPKTNQLAYHQMIQGTMQVMLYDCAKKTHAQQTYYGGNKHEVSWAPDGTHLLYSHENTQNTSLLEMFNIITKKTNSLTHTNDSCSYPHWSPCYPTFPVVT